MRHSVIRAFACACAALAVLMAAGCAGASSAPSTIPSPVSGPCSAQPPGCGGAPGTARGLAALSWSPAPAPPLSSRFAQTSVWTGTELLVWGGVQEARTQPEANDGAAFDPATRTWTAMAPSPLSPRDTAFAVWTGTRALFWGGGDGSADLLMNGAEYDPFARTWAMIPAAPLPPGTDDLQAIVWTGTQMVVIEPGAGAAFDPATGTWTSVPGLPSVAGRQPFEIRSEWTGAAIVTWFASRPPMPTGYGVQFNPGGIQYSTSWWAPGAGAWTRVAGDPTATGASEQFDGFPFGTAVAVGGRVLFVGGNDCPPGASCPAALGGGAGAWFDPPTGTWAYLPNTFSGGAGPAVWTGSAMVVFGTKAGAQATRTPLGAAPVRLPAGAAAAFDPSTGAWSDLPACPLPDLTSADTAWTGRQLIVVAMNGDTGAAPQVQVLSGS